jgi:dienelactone hydrolase
MLSAIDFAASKPDVDGGRLGIWGVDVGARAALMAAGQREAVRAVAADSAYDTIDEYLSLRVEEETGLSHPVVQLGCRYVFTLYQRVRPASLSNEIVLAPLADRSVLFIQGENRKSVAALTAALYERLQPQKEMISLSKARVRMMNAEMLEAYDRRVAHFFNISLSKPISLKQKGLASQPAGPDEIFDPSGSKSSAADPVRTKRDRQDP